MSRILFAWEHGAGTGHLHAFGAIIAPLLQAGHHITLVCKDVVGAQYVLGELNIDVLPAPVWLGHATGLKPAANYNEVLFHVGYLEPNIIKPLVAAWIKLLQLVNPDVLITEHAPTALLAARVLSLPAMVLGTGFSLPPDKTPMPTLEPWARADPKRLNMAEQRAKNSINDILLHFRASPVLSIAELFHYHPGFLLTLPELDHYGERAGVDYWGDQLNVNKTLPEPIWPSVRGQKKRGEKVFVYLHPEYRQFNGLIQALRQLNYSCLVVAPGISAHQADKLSRDHVSVIGHQVNLAQVCKQCRVIINHAAHGTMAQIFKYGRPMLMLPNFTEQTVLAWRAAKQSLGLMATPDPSKHNYGLLIEKLLDSPHFFQAAEQFAQAYREQPMRHGDLLEKLQQTINNC